MNELPPSQPVSTRPAEPEEWRLAPRSNWPVSPESHGVLQDPQESHLSQGPSWPEENSRGQELTAVLESLAFEDTSEKKAWPANPLVLKSRMPDKEELKVEEPKWTIWPVIILSESQAEGPGVTVEPPSQTAEQEASDTGGGGTPADSCEAVEVRVGAPEFVTESQFICTECGVNFLQLSGLSWALSLSQALVPSDICGAERLLGAASSSSCTCAYTQMRDHMPVTSAATASARAHSWQSTC